MTLMDCRTGAPGTELQKYEQDTWPHFFKLAQKLPEAGVHFQSKWLATAGRETPAASS